jgi:hypothetical protein
MNPPRENVRARRLAVAVVVGLSVAVAWVMAVLPALAGFGIAVAVACLWCIWLERHPGSSDSRPVPTPDGGTRMGQPSAEPKTESAVRTIVRNRAA